MATFVREDCIVRKLYCGKNAAIPRDTPNKKYSRRGTANECLAKGIGVGVSQERAKRLDPDSIQTLTYIGPVFAAKFEERNIVTLEQLIARIGTIVNKRQWLEKICTRKNGTIDQRAVNSVLLYLHDSGINVPACRIVRE